MSFFLVFVLNGLVDSAEKKYLNIGGDPVIKDICKKKSLETFLLPEDTFSATVSKSRKVSVGWLREGEEIGWVNREKNEYVICRCGNSVKFLQAPEEKIETKPEPKPEPEPVVSEAPEKKKKIIVIINKTEPEPVYVPVERRPFIDYGWSGGYAIGGGVVHHRYRHRDRHRDYSRDYRRSEPRPRPEPRHPPTPPIPY